MNEGGSFAAGRALLSLSLTSCLHNPLYETRVEKFFMFMKPDQHVHARAGHRQTLIEYDGKARHFKTS